MKLKKKSGSRASTGKAKIQKPNPSAINPATTAAGVVHPLTDAAVVDASLCEARVSRLPRAGSRHAFPRASHSEASTEPAFAEEYRKKKRLAAQEDPEGASALRGIEEFESPIELHKRRPEGREEDEIKPAFAERDRRDSKVEEGDVKKERGSVVHAAPQNHWSQKTA